MCASVWFKSFGGLFSCRNASQMGASMVKWTILDPCLGFTESDPKIYTNFEFHVIEIHKYLQNI